MKKPRAYESFNPTEIQIEKQKDGRWLAWIRLPANVDFVAVAASRDRAFTSVMLKALRSIDARPPVLEAERDGADHLFEKFSALAESGKVIVFDPRSSEVSSAASISMNGPALQVNIAEDEPKPMKRKLKHGRK